MAIIGDGNHPIPVEAYDQYASFMSRYLNLAAFAVAQIIEDEYAAIVVCYDELRTVMIHIVAVDILPVHCSDL